MATWFTALQAVLAHDFVRPADTAPVADLADWWWERADLLEQLRRKTADAFAWERVQDLVEQAEAEARRLGSAAPRAAMPWPVGSHSHPGTSGSVL